MNEGASGREVLVVVSAARAIPLRGGGEHACGVFLTELTEPLEALEQAGHRVCFTSPGGGAVHIDPNSLGFAKGARRVRAMEVLERHRAALEHPRPLEAWTDEALDGMAAVLLPGGHAPMADLVAHPGLGRVLRCFHARARPTAAVCHGVVGLLSARTQDDAWPYAGYRMTCFPRYTERLLELTGALGGRVSFYVDRELTNAGAVVRNRFPPFIPRVVRDRELLTGQDPFAAAKLGRCLVEAIAAG